MDKGSKKYIVFEREKVAKSLLAALPSHDMIAGAIDMSTGTWQVFP